MHVYLGATMAKRKVTRKAASKQPKQQKNRLMQEILDHLQMMDAQETPAARKRRKEEQRTGAELAAAESTLICSYWDDKNATIHDVLEETIYQMHRVKTILESIPINMYGTVIDGGSHISEEQKSKILWGIHNTLEFVAGFMGRRLELAEDVYVDHLPAKPRKKRRRA